MQIRNKTILIAAISFAVLTTLSGYMHQSKITEYKTASSVNNGAATCFQRVAQTFTAVMVGDLSSVYLSRDFTELSSECMSEVMQQFQGLYSENFKKAHRPLNDLISDTHWFHEKVFKAVENVRNEDSSPMDSNLIGKYSNLEAMRADFQDAMDAKIMTLDTSVGTWKWTAFGFLLAAFFTIALFAYIEYEKWSAWKLIESRVSDLNLDENSIPMAADMELIMKDTFSINDQSKVYELFNKYHSALLEKSAYAHESRDDMVPVVADVLDIPSVEIEMKLDYSESPIVTGEVIAEETIPVVPVIEEEIIGTDLNSTFNAIFERVKDKAFTSGVIVDFDMQETMRIDTDKDELSQLLMSIFSYGILAASNSTQSKQLQITASQDNKMIEMTVSMTGHFFNVSELEYLTQDEQENHIASTDLMIIKEITTTAATSFTAENKISDSGQLIGANFIFNFSRTMPKSKSQKLVRMLKGKKSQIAQQIS